MISGAVLSAEIARHLRLGFDRERSSRASQYKITADAIAELGAFGTPLYWLAAKAGKTGLQADADRFDEARAALAPRDRAVLFLVLQSRLRNLRDLVRRRTGLDSGR